MSSWGSNAMPAELTREVATRTNLLFYDWELVSARLQQIRPLSQIASMASRKPVADFSDPANKWLVASESKFGNTVTEITKTGPRELSLVRSSDSGLSAMEFFTFVQWIAGPPASPARAALPPAAPQPAKP
jgi:hypothetical protein